MRESKEVKEIQQRLEQLCITAGNMQKEIRSLSQKIAEATAASESEETELDTAVDFDKIKRSAMLKNPKTAKHEACYFEYETKCAYLALLISAAAFGCNEKAVEFCSLIALNCEIYHRIGFGKFFNKQLNMERKQFDLYVETLNKIPLKQHLVRDMLILVYYADLPEKQEAVMYVSEMAQLFKLSEFQVKAIAKSAALSVSTGNLISKEKQFSMPKL
jgi:hypothetical protein